MFSITKLTSKSISVSVRNMDTVDRSVSWILSLPFSDFSLICVTFFFGKNVFLFYDKYSIKKNILCLKT